MNQLETQCLSILFAAASSTYGLVLRTNNPAKARATLYRVRKLIGDVTLASLQIRVSPDDSEHELWLIRSENALAFNVGDLIEADRKEV